VTRVLILINSLGPYGAENFVLSHVRHADRPRFDVRVCQLGGDESLAPAIRAAGAEVVNLGERRRFDPRALARLLRLVRRERVDVLQTHVGYASVVGRLVGRLARVPVIVSTEQTVRDDRDYSPWLRRAMALTHPLVHGHVYISDAVRRSFGDASDAPIISNGIDGRALAAAAPGARDAVRRELGVAGDEIAIVNVARLHSRKGQIFAIDALARVRREHPRASLWLVGAGPDEAALRARAAERGVADAVHLLGQRLDVHRLLGGFDLYVHPALVEGLGIAVLEAMAAGLPVVASAVGGIPEYVRDGDTGWLVPPGELDALAARLGAAVADGDARRAVAARGQAHILAEHDIRASVAAYEALYTRLLQRRRACARGAAAHI
jgi:glycosyltransferase involved in cell wall biosynthesis